jgi:hypothetical protein
MKSRLSKLGRRRLSGVVVVALFALVAAGVSQGGATPSTVKSPLYKHRDSCTQDPAVNPVGTATFTRNKDILTLKVSFHSADPGTYDLWLYQAVNGDCGDSVLLGTFKVSASGDGSKVASVDVSEAGNFFFAAPYNRDTGEWAESDIVKV